MTEKVVVRERWFECANGHYRVVPGCGQIRVKPSHNCGGRREIPATKDGKEIILVQECDCPCHARQGGEHEADKG